MKQSPSLLNSLIFMLLISMTACGQNRTAGDSLLLFADPVSGETGYRNSKGDTIIPPGKYLMCYTETFHTFAIVLSADAGFIAIDRQENVLYKVFPYDNGPDEPSEGIFRIIENGKIGYADAATGKVLIPPTYDCAYPFENAAAKVSTVCSTQRDGDHSIWYSDYWYYINAEGKRIGNAPEPTQ